MKSKKIHAIGNRGISELMVAAGMAVLFGAAFSTASLLTNSSIRTQVNSLDAEEGYYASEIAATASYVATRCDIEGGETPYTSMELKGSAPTTSNPYSRRLANSMQSSVGYGVGFVRNCGQVLNEKGVPKRLCISSPSVPPSGSLDPNFGMAGIGETPSQGELWPGRTHLNVASGKIYLQTSGGFPAGQISNVIARYNPNGTIDTSFATQGVYIYESGTSVYVSNGGMYPDGRFLITRYVFPHGILMERLTEDGQKDPSFGVSGTATIGPAINAALGRLAFYVNDVELQSDGKIIGNSEVIFRAKSDGTLDPSFGVNGISKVLVDRNFAASFMRVQSDDKILFASTGYNEEIRLFRLTADGHLDTTFGNGGEISFRFLNFSTVQEVSLAEPDANGKQDIYIAAVTMENETEEFSSLSTPYQFALGKVSSSGQLDTQFGMGGKVYTTFSCSTGAYLTGMLVKDGKVTVMGIATGMKESIFSVAMARYTSDGQADSTFGPRRNGKQVIPGHAFLDAEIQSDGMIIGSSYSIQGNFNRAVAAEQSGDWDDVQLSIKAYPLIRVAP